MSRALWSLMELHKIKYGPIYLQHQRSLTSTNAQNCKICITILRAKDVQTRFFFLRSFAHLFKLLGYNPLCSDMYWWCSWHNIKLHFKLHQQIQYTTGLMTHLPFRSLNPMPSSSVVPKSCL